MSKTIPSFRSGACFTLSVLVASGCTSLGPATIPRDRFDYSSAMDESWKRQVLLNIVRLRYLDPPSFVDVGQIVSGYSLSEGVNAGGQVAKGNPAPTFASIGGTAVFTDRPTITYTPLTGNRFVRGLMTPIAPEAMFYTIQSGWPADAILELTAISINGLKNEDLSIAGYRPPDPRFLRVAELMRKIQKSAAMGMKIVVDKDRHETRIITLRSAGMPEDVARDVAECRQLLGLKQDASEFNLVYGGAAGSDTEIAVQTRSLLHIFGAMAARTEVPSEHVREGRTPPGMSPAAIAALHRPTARIRCTKSRPSDAFVAIEYRDHWFWVDDRDLVSKRGFFLMMLLFTLADTGEKENLPLITISAQ